MSDQPRPVPIEVELPYMDPQTLGIEGREPAPTPIRSDLPFLEPLSAGGGDGYGYACSVSFSPSPVKTGYCRPPAQSTIHKSVTATVSPKSITNEIDIVKTGATARIDIQNIVKDPGAGKITFDVYGRRATPRDKPEGDTTIQAKRNDTVCGQVQAIVVKPKRIRRHTQNTAGNVIPFNLAADGDTSPAHWGVPEGYVQLNTYWMHWLTITVLDQFDNVLDGVYAGAAVAEDGRPINQAMAGDGTFQDPVGHWEPRSPGPAQVRDDSADAANWPTQATMTMNPGRPHSLPQRVEVCGHIVLGMGHRLVIYTPPNYIEVVWP